VTGAPRVPFISPDGQWVGFFDYNEIRKVPITGGPSIPIAVTEIGARGAAWTTDDTIIFATGTPASGLQRVSAAGGTPEMLTRADRARGEADHVWPELLPGGDSVLFTIQALGEGPDASRVALLDLQTKAQTILVTGGSHARYVSQSSHLVYAASGTLRAVPFDPVRRLVSGASVPVISRLSTTPIGAGEFALATAGTLIYVDPGSQETGRALAWVDRNGKEELLPAPSRLYVQPRISPDGKKVALYIGDEERDIWIWELERANLIRLTTGAANDLYPLWTPDSQRIIFASSRADINIWSQSADGTGTAEQLTSGDAGSVRLPYALARDGSLVFGLLEVKVGTTNILRDSFKGERVVTPLVDSEFDERNAALSPDDRWLAYDSDSSRRREVYVRPFPTGSRQWQISTAGGQKPQWARSGRELFYLALDGAMMRVSIDTNGDTLNVGTPTKPVRHLRTILQPRRPHRWSQLRRVAGRTAFPLDQDARRRTGRDTAEPHRRPELERRAEATGSDTLRSSRTAHECQRRGPIAAREKS
jgi:WD40-like Beta Propeller Repeat